MEAGTLETIRARMLGLSMQILPASSELPAQREFV